MQTRCNGGVVGATRSGRGGSIRVAPRGSIELGCSVLAGSKGMLAGCARGAPTRPGPGQLAQWHDPAVGLPDRSPHRQVRGARGGAGPRRVLPQVPAALRLRRRPGGGAAGCSVGELELPVSLIGAILGSPCMLTEVSHVANHPPLLPCAHPLKGEGCPCHLASRLTSRLARALRLTAPTAAASPTASPPPRSPLNRLAPPRPPHPTRPAASPPRLAPLARRLVRCVGPPPRRRARRLLLRIARRLAHRPFASPAVLALRLAASLAASPTPRIALRLAPPRAASRRFAPPRPPRPAASSRRLASPPRLAALLAASSRCHLPFPPPRPPLRRISVRPSGTACAAATAERPAAHRCAAVLRRSRAPPRPARAPQRCAPQRPRSTAEVSPDTDGRRPRP